MPDIITVSHDNLRTVCVVARQPQQLGTIHSGIVLKAADCKSKVISMTDWQQQVKDINNITVYKH